MKIVMKTVAFAIGLIIFFNQAAFTQTKPAFKIVAIAESGGHHIRYSKAARIWLDKLAAENNFAIDYMCILGQAYSQL